MSYHYWTGTTQHYRQLWQERYFAVKHLLDQAGYEPFPYDSYIALIAVQLHQYGNELKQWVNQASLWESQQGSVMKPGPIPSVEPFFEDLEYTLAVHQRAFSRLLQKLLA